MKKRYILPVALIIIGCFLFFYGRAREQELYDLQPHFTGLCVEDEVLATLNHGCPEEANKTYQNPYQTEQSLWMIGTIAGLAVGVSGIVLGAYYLLKRNTRRESGNARRT